MQDQKTAEADKNPLGPRGGGQKKDSSVREFFLVGWEMSVGKKCRLTFFCRFRNVGWKRNVGWIFFLSVGKWRMEKKYQLKFFSVGKY